MENMDEYMRALDIIAKVNHVDEFNIENEEEQPTNKTEEPDVNLDLD